MAVINVEGANVLRDGVVGDGVVETRVIRVGVGGTDVAVVGVEGESVLGGGVVGDGVLEVRNVCVVLPIGVFSRRWSLYGRMC